MDKYITIIIEATMDALKKHGLIKVGIFFMVLMTFLSVAIFLWQLPTIILALKA